MPNEPYSRDCPWCGFSFKAVGFLGICPACAKSSQVCYNGQPLVLIDEERQEVPSSLDLFRNTPLPVIFEWMESGGGPVTRGVRYGNKPPLKEVHGALTTRFKWVRALLEEYGLDTAFEEIDAPSDSPDWIGTVFVDAMKLLVISWHDGELRFDLVCELTDAGGAIHALPPDAQYHLMMQ